jgi:hypothetical protein
LKKLMRGATGEDDDAFGSVPVPGEDVLTLPSGRVALRYQVSIMSPLKGSFKAPGELEVTIVSAATGEAVPIERLGAGAPAWQNSALGHARAPIARAEIPRAGEYLVTAGPALTIETSNHSDPTVLVGR